MDFASTYARQMDSMKLMQQQFRAAKQDASRTSPRSLRQRLAYGLMRAALRLEPQLPSKDYALEPGL